MAKKQKFQTMKEALIKALPDNFTVETSKTGLTVRLFYVGPLGLVGAGNIVKKVAKKFKLRLVGDGQNLNTGLCDWEYIDTNIEALITDDAKAIHKALKDFFEKWNGNEYVDSKKAYEWIDKIRSMVETDEA